MKTVFNNSEFFHQWARRVLPADAQDKIRTLGGSLSAYNRVLYSYNTAVARIMDVGTPENPRRVVLMTSNSYSKTTSRHLNEARSAVRHMTVYSVPFIGLPGGRNSNDSEDMNNVHAGNMAYFKADHDETVGTLRRARYVNGSCVDILAHNAPVAIAYAADFGQPAPQWASFEAIRAEGDAIDKYRAEREARSNTPEAIAKRAKLAATRGEREERKAARDEQERAAKAAGEVADWRAGANIYMVSGYLWNVPPLIRLKTPAKGTPYFETSHGALVPYAAGIAALTFIVAELDTLSPDNEMKIYNRVLIGDFQLISISTASVQIGCHFFEHAEIRRAHEEYCK